MKQNELKAKSARYLKIVEWSDEDQCFIGRCPGLMAGGVHGNDEAKVYAELCQAAEEWVTLLESDGKTLPPPTTGKVYSGKFMVRIDPEVHQKLALKASLHKESLNNLVSRVLAEV